MDKQIKENLEQMLEESRNGKIIKGSVDLITDILCKNTQQN